MIRDNTVGVFLAAQSDRDILRAAATTCGLRSIDLQQPASKLFVPRLPALIVTDQATGPWDRTRGNSFAHYDEPLLLRVTDADPSVTPTTSANPAPGVSLQRPLRLESVTAALRQAASALDASHSS
jgi:hypothetical protein